MKAALVCLSGFLVLACGWLLVIEFELRHPGFGARMAEDAVLAAASLAVALAANSAVRFWSAVALGAALAAGVEGVFALVRDLRGAHFEGFVLLIASALALQALLATLLLAPRLRSA